MRITILAPQRRQPRIGDRRVTKKHGLQIRVAETHGGRWVRCGSRYRYDWRSLADLAQDPQWFYLVQQLLPTITKGAPPALLGGNKESQ